MKTAISLGRGTTASGSKRVKRGGSWNNDGHNLRSAKRNDNSPGNRNNNIGFRLGSRFIVTRDDENNRERVPAPRPSPRGRRTP